MPIAEEILKETGAAPKDREIEIQLYNPHPNQLKIIQDKARFKVLRCGRRFGKTTYAVNALFTAALYKDNGTFWYVGPTYRQAKQIAWRMLLKIYRQNNGSKKLFMKAPGESSLQLILQNGSYIEIKGSDNEDSLRGVGLDGVILDEYAMMKPNVWEEIIRPTLVDTGGWANFIGTPKGLNHFYDLYSQAEAWAKEGKDWSVFHFTTYDNPFITKEEITETRKQMDNDLFEQEYLAEFKSFTGLVYKGFDEKIHTVDPFPIPPDWPRWRSIDVGFTNPFCCLWITQDPATREFYVYDEHYLTQQTIRYHANVIIGKSFGQYFKQTFIDPSAKLPTADLAQLGIYCAQAVNTVAYSKKDMAEAGVYKVAELLKFDTVTGKPKLLIFNTCKNTIQEFKTYKWMEKKLHKSQAEVPQKENDHAMDALRYFVNSYQLALNPFSKPYRARTPKYIPNNETTGY